MRRGVIVVITMLILLPWSAAAQQESVVELTTVRTLANFDLDIEGLAVSPDSSDVIVVAAEGFLHLFSATDPADEIELNSGDDDDLKDVDWHPAGQTALIVGDEGTMLRYARADHSVTYVSGSAAELLGQSLTAISWDSAGGWAYLGGENGFLMRYRENAGVGEFHILNGSKTSDITAISCHHKQHSLCAVSTRSDGVAIIDTEHNLHWLSGTSGTEWRDVDCPHPERDRCYAVGRSQSVAIILLDIYSAASTIAVVKQVSINAEFTNIYARDDGHLLIQTTPMGWVDWEILRGDGEHGEALPWLFNEDITGDAALAGETLAGGWTESPETGFGVTTFGRIIYYAPPAQEVFLSSLAGLLVVLAVPGVVLGMIFISSPKLQKKYSDWSKSRRAKR